MESICDESHHGLCKHNPVLNASEKYPLVNRLAERIFCFDEAIHGDFDTTQNALLVFLIGRYSF